ncbi:putative quinol monooxygenase [Flavobacterium panacagri]|uniref:putative quinol monooxygenase n=1 Tax=Flavobacterium panacagri TaxID=3034146 RepID=UPI0025A51428|nr:antibiotic biosynthesis monooxygenase [Flavobacterium panacagri]
MKTKNSVSKGMLGVFTVLFMNGSLTTAQIADQTTAGNQEIVAKMTRYEVKKESQEKFQKVIADYVKQSISNSNNIMSEAYFEQEDHTIIWLFERWKNRNELDKFRNNSKQLAVLIKTVLVKPEKIIYVKDLEPLTKKQWRKTSKKGEEQLTIMLFVDAKKGTENNFMEVYHKAMPEFRSEPGVVTYQLSQLKEDASQFVTFEKFRNKEAFQYHLNFPPIQPVIDYLNTSIKKQPFQDGIHNLIEFAPLIRE